MEAIIVFGFIFLLVIITLIKGIKLVPQGSKWVVERLGKYYKSLNPGLNLIVPYIDSVSFKATTKDIVLDIPSQEVITLDNVVIIANAVAYINIISPEKAVYGVEDYELAIRTLVQTSLRSIVGEMALDDALSSRDQIKAKLKESISEKSNSFSLNSIGTLISIVANFLERIPCSLAASTFSLNLPLIL